MMHEALLDQESDLDKGVIINEYEAAINIMIRS